jgi:hypothetical protein
MTRQSYADMALHLLALQSGRFRKFCFSRECEHNDIVPDRQRENVFISGVARSGSTALLTALFQSGVFASTTYAMMPFILAPTVAKLICRIPNKVHSETERAHGDGIKSGLDSAEALDGVFWSTYFPAESIRLNPQEVPNPILQHYEMFIENLLWTCDSDRYLSKMNQGIDKIGSMAAHFKRSIFIIPFRDPLQQSLSLLRQHQNFSELSWYERKYFAWLGHYEFGGLHKGFFEQCDKTGSSKAPGFEPHELNYWLSQWENSYRYLSGLADLYDNVVPVSYEQLAASTALWESLSGKLNADLCGNEFVNLNVLEPDIVGEVDDFMRQACDSLYDNLLHKSTVKLCSEN